MFSWFKKKKQPKNKLESEISHSDDFQSDEEYFLGEFKSSTNAIELPIDSVEFFPKIEVFCQDGMADDDDIFSICSFPRSGVKGEAQEKAHFISSFREYGDYPSDKWYNEYCTDYLIGFKVKENKIEILCDSQLFGVSESYERFKDEYRAICIKVKADFTTDKLKDENGTIEMRNTIRQLGSLPKWAQSDETPQIENIQFVAQLDPYKLGLDEPYLFLFYDEKEKVYYQVEQYT
ncbi:hypothetical protein [Persicobacter psychrovividus]|uniref:Uncharacterized protein n=1 Tax=Persicobacter psychrovividus TaxID=387638 RepID=A0ABN6LBL7_9BACT|nr:hypothetical protein PEPS_28800 [Persicobacter psychrovividus]